MDCTRDDFTRASMRDDVVLDLVWNHTLTDYRRVQDRQAYSGVAKESH